MLIIPECMCMFHIKKEHDELVNTSYILATFDRRRQPLVNQ